MHDELLRPTWYLDSESSIVRAFAHNAVAGAGDERERAVRLFAAVRDGIRYDPYQTDQRPEAFRASATLERGAGFCVPKAIVLAACARAQAIPSRLGFADVRNHLSTARLRERMGTDLFVFHGYVELWLGGRFVKATPTFDRAVTDRFGVAPLAFDGEHDALFQPFDGAGRRHMEYVRDRGVRADFDLDEMRAAWREHYPGLFDERGRPTRADDVPGGADRFASEADEERTAPRTSAPAEPDDPHDPPC